MATVTSISVPRPQWRLLYKDADITSNIANMVTEVRWHDCLEGELPNIEVTLQDAHRKWHSSSFPSTRDSVKLYLGYSGKPLAYAGEFTVDEFELIGPPWMMKLKAINAGVTDQMRTPNAAAFENMSFSQIAEQIARKYGYTAVVDGGGLNPVWQRVTGSYEDGGDLPFLYRLAASLNYVVQIRPPQLIFKLRTALGNQTPTGPVITPEMVKAERGAKFRWQNSAELGFGASQMSYLDPFSENIFSGQSVDNSPGLTDNTLNFTARVENAKQAQLLAESALHAQNMWEMQAELTLPGTIAWRVGQVVQLSGWGIYNGNWFIEAIEHTIAAKRGYTTKLSMRTAGVPGKLAPVGLIEPTPSYLDEP
jgi:phage protein D